jgi:hypothetical protein
VQGCAPNSPTRRSNGPTKAGLVGCFFNIGAAAVVGRLAKTLKSLRYMTATLVRLYLKADFDVALNVIIVIDEIDQDAIFEIQSGKEVKTGSVPRLIASEIVGIARSAISGARHFRSALDGRLVEISIEEDGKLLMEGIFSPSHQGSLCAELVNTVAVAASSLMLGPELEKSMIAVKDRFY